MDLKGKERLTAFVDKLDYGPFGVDDVHVPLFSSVSVPNQVFAVEKLIPGDKDEAGVQDILYLQVLLLLRPHEILDSKEIVD